MYSILTSNVDKLHVRFYFFSKVGAKQNEEHVCCDSKSSVDSVFKMKEGKIYLNLRFSLCVLQPGHHPFCKTTSRFVSGSGRAVMSAVCEMCVRT